MDTHEAMQGLALDPEAAEAFRQAVSDAAVAHNMTNGQFVTALLGLLINDAVTNTEPGIPFLRVALKASLQTLDELVAAAGGGPAAAVPTARAERILQATRLVFALFTRADIDSSDAVEALGLCFMSLLRNRPETRPAVRVAVVALTDVLDAN